MTDSFTLADGHLTVSKGLTDFILDITVTNRAGTETQTAYVGRMVLDLITRALNTDDSEARADYINQVSLLIEDTYQIQHGKYDTLT
jgi:hypothetical protein